MTALTKSNARIVAARDALFSELGNEASSASIWSVCGGGGGTEKSVSVSARASTVRSDWEREPTQRNARAAAVASAVTAAVPQLTQRAHAARELATRSMAAVLRSRSTTVLGRTPMRGSFCTNRIVSDARSRPTPSSRLAPAPAPFTPPSPTGRGPSSGTMSVLIR